jgi:glutamyl-tRNA synthetase
MALLGWSLDDHTEIISRQDLIKHFDLDRVLVNPAVFNADKLLWLNGVYIRAMPIDELAPQVTPFLERALGQPVDKDTVRRILPLVQERIKTLSEIVEMADFFFIDRPLEYDTQLLLGKRFAGDPAGAAAALKSVTERLDGVGLSDWNHETLESHVRPLAEELGLKAGDLFGVIRVAVTGKTAAPPLFETLEALGPDVARQRLRDALGRLSASAGE